MPGRKEQNKRDLKKASANCYQLDTFFKGIRKTVNESKSSFSKNQNRSTPISLDLTNSSQDIPCTSKENNSPCSEHILNEEFQSAQLILSRQQTSLGNFDFNVDLEPGSPRSPVSPTPPNLTTTRLSTITKLSTITRLTTINRLSTVTRLATTASLVTISIVVINI